MHHEGFRCKGKDSFPLLSVCAVCANQNWLYGHYGYGGTFAGGTFYDSIPTKTDWVVACGRNCVGSKVGTIINGVTASTGQGGTGNCDLSIGTDLTASNKISDWQVSSLCVWNSHLPDQVFAGCQRECGDDALYLFLQIQKIALKPYTLWVLSTIRRKNNTCDDVITMTLMVQW